jgi:antitoxin component of RelBE/YafQ-DinJ toxin-antitoxin module
MTLRPVRIRPRCRHPSARGAGPRRDIADDSKLLTSELINAKTQGEVIRLQAEIKAISLLLKKIAQTSGMPLEAIIQELEIREAYIKYMVDNNLHEQREVTEKILTYYNDEEVKDISQEEHKDNDSRNTIEQMEQNQLQVNSDVKV